MKQSLTSYLKESHGYHQTFAQCFLLNALDETSYNKIISVSHVVDLKEHAILFNQGDELTDIYLLVSGGVKLQILAPSGDEKIVDVIRAGQTFAEAVLFSGGLRYPVSAIASADSVVVALNAKAYLALLRSSNELCLFMMARLSQRLHWMINEVDQLTLHNATYRLVSFFLDQIPPETKENQVQLSLLVSKRVLASRLSIKPETLSRIFKSLTQLNLIERHETSIELLDIAQLKESITL